MELSAEERDLLRALWKKLGSNVGVYVTEALERTFLAFPCTKVYFSHMDLRPGSAQVRTHGQKVAAALTLAADHLDNLPSTLSALGDLHTTRLRVDPAHFRLLGHCLLVTLVRHFPGDFSPALQLAVDKFLDHVISALTSGREVPVVE
ncbi:hemoglobin subunit theta-1 [Ochotona curzoniae]|uniref:hemoglobin subunit theta-1 n=1 Tax=Ochotona curzoniae TaxID=130825 RepID=UPI001B353750|nr:hemoglobin subunit theta-1 [Ochotona curzoniae]